MHETVTDLITPLTTLQRRNKELRDAEKASASAVEHERARLHAALISVQASHTSLLESNQVLPAALALFIICAPVPADASWC